LWLQISVDDPGSMQRLQVPQQLLDEAPHFSYRPELLRIHPVEREAVDEINDQGGIRMFLTEVVDMRREVQAAAQGLENLSLITNIPGEPRRRLFDDEIDLQPAVARLIDDAVITCRPQDAQHRILIVEHQYRLTIGAN